MNWLLSPLSRDLFISSILCNLDSVLYQNCFGKGHLLCSLPAQANGQVSCYWVIHHFLHFPGVSRLFRNLITAYMIVTRNLFGICCIRLDASVCIAHRHFKLNLSKTISPFTTLMTKWKKKALPLSLGSFPWVVLLLLLPEYWVLGITRIKSSAVILIYSQG